MSGLSTGVTEIRSLSKFSLSVITIVFEDDVDLFFARQPVFERLQQVKEQLPLFERESDGLPTPQDKEKPV
jgi:cobalt-zinc-cadmium resistance protein CzcA